MIYLFNNNEEMIRIIPNSAIKRMYQTQTLTDENYISDRLDVEIQALNDEELRELEYMAIDDIENPQRFHYYFIVKETTERQTTSLTGVQSGIEELRKTPVYDMRPANRSPKFIADRLLEGTNWQAGYTTDDVGTISTNFYYTDVFSALKKMCMAFGIEMQFFVEITTNRIGARYIEFRKRTGKSVGKRVVYGHNALKIVKEVEKTNTVTALIGRGKGVQVSESDEGNIGYGRKIGFENVEWNTSSGAPVDKPLGQEFVEIPELTLQYGIKNANGTVRPKIGFVEFQDEESETRLIDRTYNALLELSRPQVLLETSSVYLPDTGIGDTINVVRHDRDLRYQTRVFEITWDRLANQAVDMKLGDRLGESENKRIGRISNQVSGNISTELGPTIEELVDRLTSADGKNTNWYTAYDPMTNPETMGLVRVNDNWYQPDPEYEGEFILKQWNGEMWVEILRTTGNTELVRRLEEVGAEAEEAKQAAQKAYEDAVADAKAHAEAEVQASKERFDNLFEEVELDVADAQATANSAVEQINTAIENAGFTSLDDTIKNMKDIASGVDERVNLRVQTLEDSLSAISDPDTGRLSVAEQSLEGFQDAVYNADGTSKVTQLATGITSVVNNLSELDISGRNLVVTGNEVKDYFINNTGSIEFLAGSSTMRDYIKVTPGEVLTFTKQSKGDNYWRVAQLDGTVVYKSRFVNQANELQYTVPAGIGYLRVSYPTGSSPKIERGNKATPYSPAPEDIATQSQITQLQDNINLRVAKGDVVNQINVSTEGILIDGKKIHITGTTTIDDGVIKNAHIGDLDADKITSGTIDTARLNAKDIITEGLTANVIKSEHILADALLVDKVFSNQASVNKLWAMEMWSNKISAIKIDASQINTGTLNAANVTIINLDVNNLTGNKTNFVQTAWNGISTAVKVNSTGIDLLYANGIVSTKLNAGGLLFYEGGVQVALLQGMAESGNPYGYALAARTNYRVSLAYQATSTSYKSAISVRSTGAIQIGHDSASPSDVTWLTTNRILLNGSSTHAVKYTTISVFGEVCVFICNAAGNAGVAFGASELYLIRNNQATQFSSMLG